MQQDFRVLAHRHMGLSWLWGMYAVWAVGLLMLLDDWYYSIDEPGESFFAWKHSSIGENLLGLAGLLLLLVFFPGLPTMLVGAAQLFVTRRIFAGASSVRTLVSRIFLLSTGSVSLLWLIWLPFNFSGTDPLAAGRVAVELFALSSPWLVSSVAVAWWLGRRLFPR